MSLNLYLLRHGETNYSQAGVFCGDLDAELTANGTQMAQEFAVAYETVKWEAIYTSPMKRTQATAQPLCEAVGIASQQRDGLKEIKYGKWEGQTVAWAQQNYAHDYSRWLAEPAWNAPTTGETAVEVANRGSIVVAEIAAQHSSGNVLIVSHKATIRLIICNLLGIDLSRYRYRLNVLAGSVSRVKFDVNGPLLEALGDRSYMNEKLRAVEGT